MARYRIDERESIVSIEVAEAEGHQGQLLKAFGECQAGQCSCPTNEYEKVASMDVASDEDLIRLRLEPKRGEKFDTSQLAACLDYTTAKVDKAKTDV